MKITHDPVVRSVYIALQPARIVDSAALTTGMVVDYDAEGHIVGVERLDAPAPSAAVTASPPDPHAVYDYVRALLERRVADADTTRAIMAALEHAAAV